MRGLPSVSGRILLLGLLTGAASCVGASAAHAGGLWRRGATSWRAGGWGWRHPALAHPHAWARPFWPVPHAPAGNGFGVRNPYPHVQNFSYSRNAVLPGGRSVGYQSSFRRSSYGNYTYDRSFTGPGGHSASIDASQTYNPANGSYTRTVTGNGFNGRSSVSTTDFNRTSRGNYSYSYTNIGPNGRTYARSMNQTFNPANHDLTRSGSTTLRGGQTATYSTTVNNAGNGTYDYSTNWTGFNGGSGSFAGTYSR